MKMVEFSESVYRLRRNVFLSASALFFSLKYPLGDDSELTILGLKFTEVTSEAIQLPLFFLFLYEFLYFWKDSQLEKNSHRESYSETWIREDYNNYITQIQASASTTGNAVDDYSRYKKSILEKDTNYRDSSDKNALVPPYTESMNIYDNDSRHRIFFVIGAPVVYSALVMMYWIYKLFT